MRAIKTADGEADLDNQRIRVANRVEDAGFDRCRWPWFLHLNLYQDSAHRVAVSYQIRNAKEKG